MSKPVDLLLAIIAHREISAITVNSLEHLRTAQLDFSYTLGEFVGDALLARARSQACSRFLLETPIPYMLFIDSDIQFQPQDVSKIYHDLKDGYDVIGGIYAVRGASQLSSYGWGGYLEVDGKINEIEYLATGFMGISRRMLEKIRDELKLPYLNPKDWSKCYPFMEDGRTLRYEKLYKIVSDIFPKFSEHMMKQHLEELCRSLGIRYRHQGDDIYISEDWDFCDKVRKVGGKVYADTTVQVGHMREQVFSPMDVRNLQQQQKTSETVYGAINHQIQLSQKLDEDLAEYLGMTIPKAREKMVEGSPTLARMWAEYKGKSEDFYEDNEEYVSQLSHFNSERMYFDSKVNQLVNISKQKILDIGCGIGTAVFMMAEQDNEVLGWDINKKVIEFAEFRKKKHNLKGEFTMEKPDFSQFDLIIAIDTLEHIENLREFLIDLGSKMKYGAKLYHVDNFLREGKYPMHYEEHAQHLSEWLKEARLTEWDGRWTIRS